MCCLFVRRVYKERLGVPMNMTIGYQSHADTATKSGSTTKNKFVVWISLRAWISLSFCPFLSISLCLLKPKQQKQTGLKLLQNPCKHTFFSQKPCTDTLLDFSLLKQWGLQHRQSLWNRSSAACYIHTYFISFTLALCYTTCSHPNIHTSLHRFPEKKKMYT